MPTITDQQLQASVESFQQTTADLFNSVEENRKEEFLNKLFFSLREYTKEWRQLTGLGCPVGWDQCPDGSCVPQGTGCSGILNIADFGKNDLGVPAIDQASRNLNIYVEDLASSYFSLVKSDELKEKTRDMLDETLQKFIASVNDQVQS